MRITSVRDLTLTSGDKVRLTCTETEKKCTVQAHLLAQNVSIKPEHMPRELRQIKNSRQFDKFLEGAYGRAPRMSDGNYHLYIEQRIRGGLGDKVVDLSEEVDLPGKTMALVRPGLEDLPERDVKENAVLLVGRTGAGKSMVGNLICDVKIEGKEINLELKFEAIDPIFPISHSNVESCTGCPIVHNPKNAKYSIIDYPGFDDTHGAPQDITNAFFRKEILKDVKKIKLVLVVTYSDVTVRGLNTTETFNDLFQFLGITEIQDTEILDTLASSITLVVSNVPALENTKVAKEVGGLLENYLLDDSSLPDLGKSLLEKILEKEKWCVFSAPTRAGTSPKEDTEKMRITNLIQNSSYLPKTDINIQAKVSKKYSGKIKNALEYLIGNLKKQFSDRIFDEITVFLKKFYVGMANEQALIKFQKRFEEIINSTVPSNLSELLKELSLTAGMFEENGLVDEAKDQDETIKFLRDLLVPNEAANLPHRRDWLKEFGLRERLQEWNKILVAMKTEQAVQPPKNGTLHLQGYFLKTSQITKVLSEYSDVKEIVVHSFHTILIDEDLSGEALQGIHVVIIAPRWEIRNKRIINLTGKNCADTQNTRADDGNSPGAHGKHGKPGLQGSNGGHFFGLGLVFSGIENLTIISSGGKGGPGQAGGAGRDGDDGEDGFARQDFASKWEDAHNREYALSPARGWDYVQFPPDSNNNQTLRNDGKSGHEGGNGGKGGLGGRGGRHGLIEFVSLVPLKNSPTLKSEKGNKGDDGLSGAAGYRGRTGRNWTGVWHTKDNPPNGWNGFHLPHFEPKNKEDNPKGEKATEFSEKNDQDRAARDPLASFDIVDDLFNYRKSVIEESNPLTLDAIEIFRRVYDANPGITGKANIDSFVSECQKMEDFFTKIEDKQKCLPLYMWMLERIQTYERAIPSGTSAKKIALLQCLYTSTLSKILQIKASQQSRLIIDIKGYLDGVESNIVELERRDHNVMVGVYEKAYISELNGKIAEADFFIKKLNEDIKSADGEIEAQIEKLVEEIESLQMEKEIKKDEIATKRRELQEALSKRKLFGALTVAVQCIGCCFPPTGPIVAGIVSAGLTIASQPSSASTLAAQTLATYTEGIAQVLSDDKGNPVTLNTVHLQALSRIRTLTLLSGVVNAVGANGGSEEEQLKAMDKAIKDLDAECKKLETYKEGIQQDFKKSLHQVVDGAAQMQEALKDKTKIALDFSRLAVKRAFENIKNQMNASTKSFAAGEGFLMIIRQMEEAIDTTAKIYDHIQEYEEKKRLTHYLAQLAATQVTDHEIEVYLQKVQRNVVLEQYCRAVAAVRQWAFPFASIFLGDFLNLKSFIEASSIDDFMNQVKQQLRLLKTKVNGQDTQINTAIDTFLCTGNFNRNKPNGPFYIWNYHEHGREIRDLLRGKEVTLLADVNRTSPKTAAVKFTHIELEVTSKKLSTRKQLSDALVNVQVEMRHSGLSYYRHGDNIYQMSNDQGFRLIYHFEEQGKTPDTCNEVFTKMKNGNFMLSPYTQWTVRLNVPEDFIKQFESLKEIEFHLIGRGSYVQTEQAQGKKFDLSHYAYNVFLEADKPAENGLYVSPTTSVLRDEDDNALVQKDNKNYLYKATDVLYITKSPKIRLELNNFHFIQGLQAEHLRKKVDEVVALVKEDRPVLCVYNISNVHWVTFCILKKASGEVVTLYKDSFGGSNLELIDLLKNRSAQFKYHTVAEQRGDSTSCGVLALENMRIIVRELNANKEAFLANFESHSFCTLDRAHQLRAGEFPTLYSEGVAEIHRQEEEQAKRTHDLRNAHENEVQTIVAILQEWITNNVKIQSQDLPQDAVRTLSVQIGAESTLDNYHYRIERTRDISLSELQNLLMCSPFAWYEGQDYRIEGKAIKVFKKIV